MLKQIVISTKPLRIVPGILVLFGLYLTSLYNYLLFHSLAEIFSIVVACGIFMVAWNSQRFLDNNYLLFLGIAYLSIGGVDLVHTLAYKGMGVFKEFDANLPTQLWISARYMESLSLLIAPFFLERKMNIRVTALCYTLVTFFLLGIIFYWKIFPDCFIEGVGLTPFKKISEYIISLILVFSIIFLFQKRKSFDRSVLQLLCTSIILTIGAELAFTFYISVYGLSNLIGHFFKIISFYLIYKAIIETGLVKPYGLLFRNLKQNEEALRKARDGLEKRVQERTSELSEAVNALETEVTEHKRAKASLTQSEERYRSLVENTMDGYFIFEFTTGDFLFLNQRICDLCGYTIQEGAGLSIRDVFAPEDQEKIKEMAQIKLIETRPDGQRGIYTAMRKDGSTFQAEVSASRVTFQGKTVVQGLLRDVTERERLQQQLQQAQKMEAIGRLAGGVAHDFNNLLTSIMGYANLILKGLPKGDPQRLNVEEVLKSGQRAASLIRQLLAFSRKQVFQMEVMDFNRIITDLEKMLGRLIGEDMVLKTNLASDLRGVEADPGQMEQVIMNLVINARDAMPKGGALTIETSNVNLDKAYASEHGVELKPGSYVMLAVSDNGVGMDEETRSRIFEPFFTTKEIGKGTGLGLATVYGIIKQSNAFIWVYSEPGQGTTFKIYFPAIKEKARPVKDKKIPLKQLKGTETILVVEDDNAVRNFVIKSLAHYGYSILEAKNGTDALQNSEQQKGPIHLVVTDVVMPGMSSQELISRLQSLHPQTKILYMSGYTDNTIVKHGILKSGVNFIEKPFSPDSIVLKIRNVLDSDK